MRLCCLLLCWGGISLSAAERINHEGRILGPVPTVSAPTLFNTAQADAVVAAMQIMPTDSPWNEVVSGLPLLVNSATMTGRITNALTVANRKLFAFQEMNFVLVPEGQANVPISFVTYPGESDPSPYPIPSNLPIELFPTGTGALTLAQWQVDLSGGDRHALIVKPFSGGLWETWQTLLVGSAWQAANGAFFNLNSNVLRTDGFTSGDAAGLPMFPALVRYDEVQRGAIEHAMRLVVRRTRAAHIYPATHDASNPSTSDPDVPAMGERLRLRASFTIPVGWSAESKAVAIALKKYGCLVADNGNFFQISVTPDQRWPSGCFDDLSGLNGIVPNDFEVVQSTGPTGGPRSTLTAKPTANAGADQLIPPGMITLAGSSTGTGTTATWSLYPGAPGTVLFGNANLLTSSATFTTPGVYTLLLQVADGIHTPAYDAVMITVSAGGVNPVPTVTSLSPSSAIAGSAGFLMTVQGANFALGNATVSWPGQAALIPNPASMTANQMVVTVPAAYIAAGGVPAITVTNGAPVGGTSASKPFIISAPASGSGGSGSGEAAGGGGCGAGTGLAFAVLAMLMFRQWR